MNAAILSVVSVTYRVSLKGFFRVSGLVNETCEPFRFVLYYSILIYGIYVRNIYICNESEFSHTNWQRQRADSGRKYQVFFWLFSQIAFGSCCLQFQHLNENVQRFLFVLMVRLFVYISSIDINFSTNSEYVWRMTEYIFINYFNCNQCVVKLYGFQIWIVWQL